MNKQRGITFIGIVVLLALGLSILLAGVKIVPAYLEHSSVKKVIKSLSEKPEFSSMTKSQIIKSFNKSASISYVTVVSGSDLIIGKGADGNPSISLEYQVVTPLIANLSALMDFEASTDD